MAVKPHIERTNQGALLRSEDGGCFELVETPMVSSDIIASPDHMPWPLQQHPDYATAVAKFGDVPKLWTILSNDRPVMQAIVPARRLFGLASMRLIMRGPRLLVGDLPPSDHISCYYLLRWATRLTRWRFSVLMPEQASDADLRAAGWTKVMTGYATLWLDLADDPDVLRSRLDGKWRNQLVQAEKLGLQVIATEGEGAALRWLLEQEDKQQQTRGYQALPIDFVSHFRRIGGKTVTLLVQRGREKLAAGLFLCHGHSATYHMGSTSPAGRQVQAMNLLLWQALLALRVRQIRFVDLGGLNTADMANIARFKLGLVGLAQQKSPAQMPGAFV